MLKGKIYLPICMASLLLTGCVGLSEDPSQGGLFSYSPETYDQRAQEREARLAAIEEQQKQESATGKELASAKNQMSATLANQEKQLKALDSKLATLKKDLSNAKIADAEKQKQLDALKARLYSVEGEMDKANSSQSTGAREAYLEELRKEYESLEQDMEALLLE